MWRMELQILMVLSFLCCMCFCIVVSLVSSVQFPSCVPVLLPSLFFLPTRTASPWLARPWSWCSFIYSLLCICSLNQTYLVKQFICPQCLLQVIFCHLASHLRPTSYIIKQKFCVKGLCFQYDDINSAIHLVNLHTSLKKKYSFLHYFIISGKY